MRLGPLHISVRRAREVAQETPTVLQRLHRLEMAHGQLVEHFSALSGAHQKLRNQFHGSKGGRPPAEPGSVSEIPRGDKEALRRALGVVPGRPYNHKQE